LALPGCHQPESLALLAARVAFDCPWGHAETFGRAVRVLPLGGGRGLELADGVAGGGLAGRLPGRVAGRGDLLVFATYLFDDEAPPRRARLWRLEGRRKALVCRASASRLRRALSVDRRSRLAGVSDGLVAWADGTEIHLLRLRDGRQATIRTTSRSAVEAALTSAGLFYALHPRRVARAQVA